MAIALWEAGRTAADVQRAQEMGIDWVYLTDRRGLPPEAGDAEHEAFSRAVQVYHEAGIRVVGAIPVASCATQGSYRERSWYAVDAWGRRISAGEDRAFTCWNAPEWLMEVQEWVRSLIISGADGLLLRDIRAASCHDERCKAAYAEAHNGAKLPRFLGSDTDWQTDLIARRLSEWIAFARDQNRDLLIAVEAENPLQEHLKIPKVGADLIVISGGAARFQADGSLSQNAAAIALVRSQMGSSCGIIIPNTPTSVAEAKAQQAIPILTESGKRIAEDAIGQGANISPLAVVVPPQSNRNTIPMIWAASQTLIQHGLPFRLVTDQEDWSSIKTLLVPPGEGLESQLSAWQGRVIALGPKRPGVERRIWGSYHPNGRIHKLIHRSEAQIVPLAVQNELMQALGEEFVPRTEIEGPGGILFTMLRELGGGEQWSFVNYADQPQRLTVHAEDFVSGWVYTAGESQPTKLFGHALIMTVDQVKVVRFPASGSKKKTGVDSGLEDD